MDTVMKISKLFLAASTATAFIIPQSSFATKYVVVFGGMLGSEYCPASFSAKIGDTVQWNGSFANYVLSSTIIPSGAASFHNDMGATFSYIIKEFGVYNYRSNKPGMSGCFNVPSTAITQATSGPLGDKAIAQSTMSGGRTLIILNIQNNELVTGSLMTLSGKKLATLVNDVLGPGVHSIPLNDISGGSYIVKLSIGSQETVIKTLVAR